MAYVEPKDGTLPMYGNISYVSETANSITIRIAANTVTSTVNNIPLLLLLNPRTIDNGTTIEKIFTELNDTWWKFYIKDSTVNQTAYVEFWDDTINTARVWVILDSLTTSQKDIILEFDILSSTNTLISHIGIKPENIT